MTRGPLSKPPAIIEEIAQLAVQASATRRFEVFRALRICKEALERAAGSEPQPAAEMTPDGLVQHFRLATEDDVENALVDAAIALPITNTAEALELFNIMLDELTGERAQADAMDAARIATAKHGSD